MLRRRDNNESVTTTGQARQPWDRFWELVLPDERDGDEDGDEEGSWEADDFMSFGSDTETLSTMKSCQFLGVKSAKANTASRTSIGSLSLADSTLGSRSTADQGKSPLAALSSESSNTILRVASLGALSSGSASTDPRSLETRSTKGSFFSTSKMSGGTLTIGSKLSNIRKIKSRGPLDGFWECVLGDELYDEDEYETAWDSLDPASVSDIVSDDDTLSESSSHKEDIECEIRHTKSDSALDRKRKNFWRRGRKLEQSDQPSSSTRNATLGLPFFSISTPTTSTKSATHSVKHQNTENGTTADNCEKSKFTILALASGATVARLRSTTKADSQTSKKARRWSVRKSVKNNRVSQTNEAEAKSISVFQTKADSQESGTTKQKRLGISALVLAGSEASRRRVTGSRSKTIPASQALSKEKRWGGVSPLGGKKNVSGETPREKSAAKKTSGTQKEELGAKRTSRSTPGVPRALIAGSGALFVPPFLRGNKSASRHVFTNEPKTRISSLLKSEESSVISKSRERANTTNSVEYAPATTARKEETKPIVENKGPGLTSTVTGGVAAASMSIIAGLKHNGWTSQPKTALKRRAAKITTTRSVEQSDSKTKESRRQGADEEAFAFPHRNVNPSSVPPQENNSRMKKFFAMPTTSRQQGPLNRPKSEATFFQDESAMYTAGHNRLESDLPTIGSVLADHNNRRRKRASRGKDDSSRRTLTSTSNSSNEGTDDRWIWEIDATAIPAMNTLRTSLALGTNSDSKKKSVRFSKDVDLISQKHSASFFRRSSASNESRNDLRSQGKESRIGLGSKVSRSHHKKGRCVVPFSHSPTLTTGVVGQSERVTPKVRSASYTGSQSDGAFDLRPAFDFDAFKFQNIGETIPTQNTVETISTQSHEKRKKTTNKWFQGRAGQKAGKERLVAAESSGVAMKTRDTMPLPEVTSIRSRWPQTGQEFARQIRDSAFMVPLGSSLLNSDCSDTDEGNSHTKDVVFESRNHESDSDNSTAEEDSRELQCDESTSSDNHLILLESLRSAKETQDFSRYRPSTGKMMPGRLKVGLYNPAESNSLLTSDGEQHESFLFDEPLNSAFGKVADDGSDSEASEGEIRRKLWTGDRKQLSPRPTQSRSYLYVTDKPTEDNDDGSGKIFVNPHATVTLPREQRTVVL